MKKQSGLFILDALPFLMIFGICAGLFIFINQEINRSNLAKNSKDPITMELGKLYSTCRNDVMSCEKYAMMETSRKYLVTFDNMKTHAAFLGFEHTSKDFNVAYNFVYDTELKRMQQLFSKEIDKCNKSECIESSLFHTGIEYMYPVEKVLNYAKTLSFQVADSFENNYKIAWMAEDNKSKIIEFNKN